MINEIYVFIEASSESNPFFFFHFFNFASVVDKEQPITQFNS